MDSSDPPTTSARTKNVVLTEQQVDIITSIQVRRQCSFSEALRRVLDSWIDLHAEGKARA